MTEAELVRAAGTGDEDAYRKLVEPHRDELRAHCYRMLGSVADADDALQEVLLRAWKGMGHFEGRSSVRTWLHRIATNACLNFAERRPRRLLPFDYGPESDPHAELDAPLTESVWVDPFPTPEGGHERLESVELAFVAALQHLAPAPRAVLLLRDVLGYSAAETASLLGVTSTAVHSSLQRAHKALSSRVPGKTQQATLAELGDSRVRALVGRYVDAWERADVDALVLMLTEDVVLSMPPLPNWYRGRDAVASFFGIRPLRTGLSWRAVPTWANGQPAFGMYLRDDAGFAAHSLTVLTFRDSLISEFTAYLDEAYVTASGLPARLAP